MIDNKAKEKLLLAVETAENTILQTRSLLKHYCSCIRKDSRLVGFKARLTVIKRITSVTALFQVRTVLLLWWRRNPLFSSYWFNRPQKISKFGRYQTP